MKIKKIIHILICIVSLMICESDFEKYRKLKVNNVASVKKSDLPCEFCDEAFHIVDEFIKKTANLDYEILIIFDYIEGEILACKFGSETNVNIEFQENGLTKQHIASIHNHTKNVYSPPSDKNFGIFTREWEDYELIAGIDELWILKGKLKDEKLTFELKTNSQILFNMTLDYYSKRCENINERNDKIDKEYGKNLSKYINNKNINEIQLIKREYNHDHENS